VHQRIVSFILLSGALIGPLAVAALAPVAMAAPPNTCVTVCEAKADRCAQQCVREAGDPYDACQMACARTLFVACFDKCSATGQVVADDFVVVPAHSQQSGQERQDR
jgi:hypothetical protein